MSELIRCFIAIRIPGFDPLRRVLKELAQMGRALKAVEPGNLHVTLKFLGDTDVNRISQIGSLVEQVAQSRQPCVVKVAGLGVFPHLERPNVVWAGLEGAETLAAIAADLETGLEEFGFAREYRPFVPHLTLARVKARPPESLRPLLSRHAKTDFGTATIDQVELIRSELGPEGSKYTVLTSVPLRGGMAQHE
ncbi:MAG TPA: RNA 2',3'-cyclic phosphodiesterase [Planctomycetaceae bacterium]|nr:RNA 2',3'-cyclic phosphodiesterase [Planctomycetaceae bacterium]